MTKTSFYLTADLKSDLVRLAYRQDGQLQKWGSRFDLIEQDVTKRRWCFTDFKLCFIYIHLICHVVNVMLGGSGLYGTTKDYLTFLRHLLLVKGKLCSVILILQLTTGKSRSCKEPHLKFRDGSKHVSTCAHRKRRRFHRTDHGLVKQSVGIRSGSKSWWLSWTTSKRFRILYVRLFIPKVKFMLKWTCLQGMVSQGHIILLILHLGLLLSVTHRFYPLLILRYSRCGRRRKKLYMHTETGVSYILRILSRVALENLAAKRLPSLHGHIYKHIWIPFPLLLYCY